MIASFPGVIPAGTQSNTMVHAVDYYPTFLQLAGIKPSPDYHLDGQSFANVLTQPKSQRKRTPIAYHFPGYMDDRAAPTSTIISNINGQRFKLIHYYEDGNNEIYNLSKDLSEKNDLTQGSQGNPEVEQVLMKQLRNWLTQDTPGWAPKYPKDRKSGKSLSAPSAK
jgi:arylsulfatase A-like enzyme